MRAPYGGSTDPRTAENALTAPARGAAARAWLRAPAARARRARWIHFVGVGGAQPAHGMRISRVEAGPAGGWCLSVSNAGKGPERASKLLKLY